MLLLPHVPLRRLQVDPFDAQEAKPYKQDPEIIAMTNLVDAYQNNNINEFERILRSNRCAVPPVMRASTDCWAWPTLVLMSHLWVQQSLSTSFSKSGLNPS